MAQPFKRPLIPSAVQGNLTDQLSENAMKSHFAAPWSTKLKLLTAAFLLLCGAVYFYAGGISTAVVPALILACAVFAVRGYSIHDSKLLIHRLGWSKTFNLAELSSVEASPGVTMGSVRTWGIGGLFGYVGYFHNSTLGTYRAYATDRANAVVLDFEGQKVVVTPEGPAEFVEALRSRLDQYA